MRNVNKKKSITLKNRTNHFDPKKDKVRITFSSPESYQNKSIKQEGYETRLYWQFRYCEENKGQTFYYTLTYNDTAMPKKFGMNCFDYEDLRDLLTGGFRKQLLRKYGSTFKYFIGAELGDGKGERGMHNNPHYHCLFFVENAKNDKFPYRKIKEDEMTHLIKLYWQGFDERRTGYRDYNTAKYGIIAEGKFGAIVKDFRAINYVSKYVCKDVNLIQNEKVVIKQLKYKLNKQYRDNEETYRGFFYDEIYPMYNTPLNSKKTKWCFTDIQLIKELIPDAFDLIELAFGEMDKNTKLEELSPYVTQILNKENLWQKYYEYVDRYIQPKIKEGLNEWRNRYCNKCRISHGVGEYGLSHIRDKMNPGLQVPGKKGFKIRPIGMYYYRKLYTDVVKDSNGQNLYVLNELGQQYKAHRLPKQIHKLMDKSKDYINIIRDKKLYNEMLSSDVNTDVFLTYEQFNRQLNKILKDNNIQNILKHYAEYKLVYENRFFTYNINRDTGAADIPGINILDDYKRFLVPSFYSIPRNDMLLDMFLEDIPENYMDYSQHPYFNKYIGIFNMLDLCADYLFVQNDNKKQKDAEEHAATKRFHNQIEMKKFYANFK